MIYNSLKEKIINTKYYIIAEFIKDKAKPTVITIKYTSIASLK